ncbi:PKD domain-containing protein [Chitinophaga sp. 22321]|uniref:PKD domain-containing protein n=1 Tax=Chitinophaga hostae TaxID=2831022 RepID=A0ABS5J4H8_9BACT|nr:PKD domain-containing protein [Chitinophaga hostae]MBS0030125.1 PKD domain-containing protein [Chitinophaga hostae]
MYLSPAKHRIVVSLLLCFFAYFVNTGKVYAQQKADFEASVVSDCESVSTTFTDLSDGAPVAWQWDFGNGYTSTKKKPSATYLKTGNYTVTLKVTYGDGSSKTAVKTDYIHVRSKPVVNFSVSPNKGCVPFSTTFTDKSQPGDGSLQSFSWDFGDGGVAENAGSSIAHTYTVPGAYSAVLTVTNSYGCTNFKVLDKVVDVAPAINADFSVAEKVLCKAPVEVNFSNTSSGPGTLSYKWDFDDGGSSTQQNPGKHTFTTKGTHSITLTVKNERGCAAVKKVDDINVANYATTLSVPTLVCSEQNSNFVAGFSPVQPQSTNWEINGQPAWAYNNNTLTYHAPAAGPVKIKVTAMYGNCPDVVEKTVDVKPTPSGNISMDDKPICAVPATINFKAGITGASSWNWDFADGQQSTQENPVHNFNQEGYFYVRLTATSKDGCAIRREVYLTVNSTRITPTVSNASGCEGLTANFDSYSSSSDVVKTFQWDFGDGSTSTAAAPTHTYPKAGNYMASLKYTTVNGCTGTVNASSPVQVYKKPTVDFSSPDAPEVCGNTNASFISKSDVGDTWYWNFGDNGMSGYGSTVQHSYQEPGLYDVTLTVSNGTCPNSATKTAYIKAVNPFPRFSVSPVNCDQRTTVNVSEYSLGANSWKWSWGDGKDTAYTVHSDNVTHIYEKSGDYTIQLTTSDGHCTTYLSSRVSIIAPSLVTITTDKTTLCSNESFTARVTAEDGSIHNSAWPYHWQLDGSDQGWWDYNKPTQVYSGLTPGKHTVNLRIQDRLGCFNNSNVIDMDVRGPIVDYNLPSQIECKKTELTFTDNSDLTYSSSIAKWVWNFGDNTPSETFSSPPFRHTYQTAGNFVPTLTVTDKEGCINTFSGKNLQVNGPNADFTPDAYVVMPGANINFWNNSNETGGTITELKWDLGDGNTSTEPYYLSHVYPDEGIYKVKLQIKDDNGCTDETTKTIKVAAVGASFTYTYTFVNGGNCAPAIYRFNNTSINYTTCAWDFGDGSTSDQAFPVHTYTNSGHYKVTLKVKGIADTEDEYSEIVIVKGPYAVITASAEGGCLEKEITFTVKPENATSFSWDFTDGNVEETNALEVKHHFTDPGIYKPQLIVKDAAGCKGSAFLDHPVVIDQLDIKLHPSVPKLCDEGTLTFAPVFNSYSVEDLGITPAFTWTYDPSLTPKNINTTTPEFFLDKVGVYTFGLEVTTKYGCHQKVSEAINVYPKPLAAISGPDKACKDVPVNFGGSVTRSTDVTWAWDLGNGNSSSVQQPPAQSYATPGNTNIILKVTSADGCMNEASHAINILPLPDIKASSPAAFICLGNTIPLHAGGGNIYEWSPATGLDNAGIANPTASPAITTTYQVKVTDNDGCINTDEVKLRVVQPFTVHATPDTVLCLGDKLPLRAWGADFYSWRGEGLDQPNASTPVSTLPWTGAYTYEVTGYDKDNCFSDQATVNVTVNARPQVSAGIDRETMAGVPVYLASNNSNDVIRWKWTPADYLDCSSCPRVQAIPNLTTRYEIEVENTYGCKASDDVIIHVLCNQSAIYMPTAFTPNNDGRNERIYPKGKGVKEIEWLRIYDRWGTLVFEKTHFPVNVAAAGWDGRNGNHAAPLGTYIYSMQTVCESGEKFEFKGSIILIK